MEVMVCRKCGFEYPSFGKRHRCVVLEEPVAEPVVAEVIPEKPPEDEERRLKRNAYMREYMKRKRGKK